MKILGAILLIFIIILLVWNFIELYFRNKSTRTKDEDFFELKAKINFITAFGSFILLVIAFLGYTAKDDVINKINKDSQQMIDSIIDKSQQRINLNSKHMIDSIAFSSQNAIDFIIGTRRKEVDSLLRNKDILKARIYIVTDIYFTEDSTYKFNSFKTIDNMALPEFNFPPKLMISTNTGENLRIKRIEKNYFILGRPQVKNFGLLIADNPDYKEIPLKFDVWIADYKTGTAKY